MICLPLGFFFEEWLQVEIAKQDEQKRERKKAKEERKKAKEEKRKQRREEVKVKLIFLPNFKVF